MRLSKLLLASAVALSSSAFAMESMDDASLSDTSGQAGLTISLAIPTLSFSAILHDTDGFAGATAAGGLVIGDPLATTTYAKASINTGGGAIGLVIDASGDGNGATAGTPATLQIGVTIPTGTIIHTGDISVATSNGLGVAVTNQTAKILNDMTITLGATTMNMQLGNAPQGAMIKLNTVMTGGLSIANFALNDVAGGSNIGVVTTALKDVGGANLTVQADISAKVAGLEIKVNQLGHVTNGLSMQLTGVTLGATPSIGNVDVIGLNMNNTVVTIAGH